MLLLSYIESKPEELKGVRYFTGVTIDTPALEPRSDIKFISMMLQLDNGDISLDTIDALIAYESIANEVVLEASPNQITPELLNSVLITCHNIGANFALLPFEIGANKEREPLDKQGKQKYIEVAKLLIAHWISSSHGLHFVYPVSSFYEYLVMEYLGCPPKNKSENHYIKKSFIPYFDESFENELKNTLREEIYKNYGSQALFEQHVIEVSVNAATLVQQQLQHEKQPQEQQQQDSD